MQIKYGSILSCVNSQSLNCPKIHRKFFPFRGGALWEKAIFYLLSTRTTKESYLYRTNFTLRD